MSDPKNLVVIHLSATAVYAVIGQVVAANDIRIMGIGQVASEDYQCGIIKHRDRLKNAIRRAIIEAEEMANCRVHSVWLTLSTPELLSTNSFGRVEVASIVEIRHIVQALSKAKTKDMPASHYLMHHCQQGIMIDKQDDMVDDAVGMYAQSISVMYHLMMMPVASRQSLQQLIQSCDVSIDHILFDAVSSGEYGLLQHERLAGTCLIDIGASTTSICVYSENRLVFTHCLSNGGNQVTMDISADLGLTMAEAENLKRRHGTADVSKVDAGQFTTVERMGKTDEVTINLLQLSQIIEARYTEILGAVYQQLDRAELLSFIDTGVVLAGGGSQMNGLTTFAKRFLNLKVVKTNIHDAISAHNDFVDEHTVKYLNSRIKDPALQTAFGALIYSQSEQFQHSEKSSPDALQTNRLQQMTQRLQHFLKKLL